MGERERAKVLRAVKTGAPIFYFYIFSGASGARSSIYMLHPETLRRHQSGLGSPPRLRHGQSEIFCPNKLYPCGAVWWHHMIVVVVVVAAMVSWFVRSGRVPVVTSEGSMSMHAEERRMQSTFAYDFDIRHVQKKCELSTLGDVYRDMPERRWIPKA